jgi:hypothetical protein
VRSDFGTHHEQRRNDHVSRKLSHRTEVMTKRLLYHITLLEAPRIDVTVKLG